MNNFWQRAITGTVFVAIIVGAIVLGGWYMHITFGAIVIFGLLEFYELFGKTDTHPQHILGTVLGTSIYTCLIFISEFTGNTSKYFIAATIGITLLSLIIISILELPRSKENPFQNISITYGGIFYIVLPFILLSVLAEAPNNYWLVLSIFILIWCNDTFAYLTGRLIGKHKLFERISPKKTWEGFIGGIIFAIIGGVTLAYFLEVSYIKYVTYAIVAGAIGTAGDLVESMLKRSVDVKDSGTILPGHGGILDRFDAVLFVVPVIFFLEKFIFAHSID